MSTLDDDGRRRETTRIVIVNGEGVALGQPRPVVAKRATATTPVAPSPKAPATVVRRLCAAMVGVTAVGMVFSAWFVPISMLCGMGWLMCLYRELPS